MNQYSLARLFHLLMITTALLWGQAVVGGVAAPIFGSHMVLQRGMPVPVWGTTKPGSKVTVTFAGQDKSAVADAKGAWSVKLDPLEVNAKAQTMTIVSGEGDQAETATFEDVLVGEVWFCSGQSNMEWTLNRFGKKDAIAAADHPLLRYNRTQWQVCAPDVAGEFSGTAYFFGLNLLKDLNVPIGLINRSVGGTPIEFWMSNEVLLKIPYAREMTKEANSPELVQEVDDYDKARSEYGKAYKAWREADAKGDKSVARPQAPTAPELYYNASVYRAGRTGRLYEGLVKPVIPYAIRGMIWYQGERNSRLVGGSQAYRDLLPAMIGSWRQEWGQGNIPFLYVQLPNFSMDSWPLIRESMLECLKVENTGMAVTIDVGQRGNIHPPDKEAVGQRLALLALKKAYGRDVVAESPLLDAMKIEGAKVILTFRNVGSGLELREKKTTGFEVAGPDKKYVPAAVRLLGKDSIEVSSPDVAAPVSVRYDWAADPDATVYNKEGLPASPFRAGEK